MMNEQIRSTGNGDFHVGVSQEEKAMLLRNTLNEERGAVKPGIAGSQRVVLGTAYEIPVSPVTHGVVHAANAAEAMLALKAQSALDVQVGGDHYKKLKIQPMQYSMANGLDACQHTIVKYVTRFRDKGGIADLEKAKHTIDLLIEMEQNRAF